MLRKQNCPHCPPRLLPLPALGSGPQWQRRLRKLGRFLLLREASGRPAVPQPCIGHALTSQGGTRFSVFAFSTEKSVEGSLLLFLITLVMGQGASGRRGCTLKGGILVCNKIKNETAPQLRGALRAPRLPSPRFLDPDNLLLLVLYPAGPRPQGQAACCRDRAKNSSSLQEGPLIPGFPTAFRRLQGEPRTLAFGREGKGRLFAGVETHPGQQRGKRLPSIQQPRVHLDWRKSLWTQGGVPPGVECCEPIPAPASQRSPGSGCEVSC